MSTHGIDYMPGCRRARRLRSPPRRRSRFAPGGEQRTLLPEALLRDVRALLEEFVARRDGAETWEDYTPYELRNVGTFVRLGWRERAHGAARLLLRRPAAARRGTSGPRSSGASAREPRFIGDMPHAWVASDYVRSALDLFAYERETDNALVLAARDPVELASRRGHRGQGTAHAARRAQLLDAGRRKARQRPCRRGSARAARAGSSSRGRATRRPAPRPSTASRAVGG